MTSYTYNWTTHNWVPDDKLLFSDKEFEEIINTFKEKGKEKEVFENVLPLNDVDSILHERGKRYGSYSDVSNVSQGLKFALREGRSYEKLTDKQKESLDMICNKIARIVNGDPTYKDSWDDIIGYTKLANEE